MTETENGASAVVPINEIQQGWHDLTLRVEQLETERDALEQENKALRFLMQRIVEHRQKSHGELVLLLTGLVSKLPINDVGVVVSKLVEHNAHVNEVCSVLAKGKADAPLPQPAVLKALDHSKRELTAALKPVVEELIKLDTPLETEVLQSLIENPDVFFSPAFVRANRCFIKGQIPRERIVKQFSEEALVFFNDMTTDPKLNPRPKPEEILLGFKSDFEALFQQHGNLLPDKRPDLLKLYQRVQRSKGSTDEARAQRIAFQKLSFIVELLHYYENQSTEAPDVVFAQRLPALVEQMILSGQDSLQEKLIVQAEELMGFVVSADHRQMVINNVGKGGGLGRTLKYVLKLRADKLPDQDQIVAEFVKRLIPTPQKTPAAAELVATLGLIHANMRAPVVRNLMTSDRLSQQAAENLGKTIGKELGLTGLELPEKKQPEKVPVETERQTAWDTIKGLFAQRRNPAAIAAAIRDRLHAKYEADEIKQSWLIMIEADPVSFIRVFSQLPYLPNGKTDPIAKPVMETYVSRLLHEKYAATYHKVLTSLKNMFKANPRSPTLLNFMAMVKWVDPEAAAKLSADIGMQAPA